MTSEVFLNLDSFDIFQLVRPDGSFAGGIKSKRWL
jgi:hypothetical protein